jgi:DNA-binding CsgD family transcriptional regulator
MHEVENMLRRGPYHYYKKVLADCAPIFSKLNMTAFAYASIEREGPSFTLCSNPGHYEHYYLNDVYKHDPCCNRSQTHLHPINLWMGILNRNDPGQELVYQQQVKDKLFNGACIKVDTATGYETYDFATDIKDISVLNQFVSNLDLVRRFIIEFKSKYRDELKKNRDHFINLSKLIGNEFLNSDQVVPESADASPGLIKNEKNKIEILFNGNKVKLTLREAQCLYYLWQGKSAKETGDLICLSQRTVETHIETLRSKTSTRNKFELARNIDVTQIDALSFCIK